MMYFVMARHNDARAIIDYYGLKKDMSGCPFTIFMTHDVVLCISGEGRINAAAATAYVLTRWGKDGLLIHLGPAGVADSAIYPYVISDDREVVYQEMLYKQPPFVHEGMLEDSEGVSAFLAAARFLPLKQIMVLRIGMPVNEGILLWLETICAALRPFGMTSFPISMWKKERGSIQ